MDFKLEYCDKRSEEWRGHRGVGMALRTSGNLIHSLLITGGIKSKLLNSWQTTCFMSQGLPTSLIPSLCSPFFLCVILIEFLSCHDVIVLYSFMLQYLGILLFPRSGSPPTFPQWPLDKLLFILKTPMQNFPLLWNFLFPSRTDPLLYQHCALYPF